MSKVTDVRAMFYGCTQLTTIYCSKTWNVGNAYAIFWDCKKLKGAVSYSSSRYGIEMANPDTGYFTRP